MLMNKKLKSESETKAQSSLRYLRNLKNVKRTLYYAKSNLNRFHPFYITYLTLILHYRTVLLNKDHSIGARYLRYCEGLPDPFEKCNNKSMKTKLTTADILQKIDIKKIKH
jgi:hypothetical protein